MPLKLSKSAEEISNLIDFSKIICTLNFNPKIRMYSNFGEATVMRLPQFSLIESVIK